MGWISYLEDITDRFAGEFEQIHANFQHRLDEVTPSERERLVRLICRGEAMLAEARSHLELATDPSLDLAAELELSREKSTELRRKLAAFESTCLSLASSLKLKDQELQTTVDELKALKTKHNQLKRDFEKVVTANPMSAYEQYSDPGKIRKLKPDA